MLVLKFIPVAFAVSVGQRVHLRRKVQRNAFAEDVAQEVSAHLRPDAPHDLHMRGQDPPLGGVLPVREGLRVEIWIAVISGVAIGLFFYLLPPLYR
jgi:hypothetical protein